MSRHILSLHPLPTLLANVALICPAASMAAVFINEIHYDNVGADVGERIEVVATAGEDLSQYRLHFYNGSDGNLSTSTQPAIQTLPAGTQVSCGGTVSMSVLAPNQIENGSPDGVALEGPGGVLVQFLSWEGSFMGNVGIAAGHTSTDIGVSEPGSTPVGTSLQLGGGPGNSAADFQWNASASDTFGTCNHGQTFTAAADLPPRLIDSVPVANGTLSTQAQLRLVFSEPVNVAGDWFQIRCNTSGVHTTNTTTVSGGPVTWQLTPTPALQANDQCELILEASLITDLDGTPDPLDDPGPIPFRTVAPQPPSLLATVPVQGETSFPPAAALHARFNEAVTIDAGAFTLNCDNSTSISLSPNSSDGINWVIGTGTILTSSDTCRFGIHRDFIQNSEGTLLDQDSTISFIVAETGTVGSYYQHVNPSSPEQLRCSLHATIRGHTAYPYSGNSGPNGVNTWTILEAAQQDPNDPNRIIDSYRNRSYLKGADRAGTGGSNKYNREHTWPRSLGFSGPENDAQGNPIAPNTDTHMLHLTDAGQNTARGNLPLANCPSSAGCNELQTEHTNGVGGGSGTYPGNSNWVRPGSNNSNQGSFEVWNHRKGDIARAVLYMAIRYEGGHHPITGQAEPNLELTDNRSLIVSGNGVGNNQTYYMGLLTDLLAWHEADPPSAEEGFRNDLIQQYQGNRNPFVDHPEWATRALFESTPPATCILLARDIFSDGFED